MKLFELINWADKDAKKAHTINLELLTVLLSNYLSVDDGPPELKRIEKWNWIYVETLENEPKWSIDLIVRQFYNPISKSENR